MNVELFLSKLYRMKTNCAAKLFILILLYHQNSRTEELSSFTFLSERVYTDYFTKICQILN